MGRRGNAEGSIYKRRDGRWEALITVGGQRKSFYAKTRAEAARRLNVATRARQDGLPLSSERQTVGTCLLNWLETARPSVRPATYRRYEQYVRLHTAEIGKVTLARLEPRHLQRLYASRIVAGLSPMSVRHLHALLHRALGQAVRWGQAQRNVVELVDPPRAARRDMTALTPEQARTFLASVVGDRLEALYLLAVTTGMRQGEILGLRWSEIDLESRSVRVRAALQRTGSGFAFVEPKTARSRRQIALTESAAAALRKHRAAQLEERLRLGPAWEDLDLVFANVVGRPIDPSNLSKFFHDRLEHAGLPRVRFHDLRHTAATLLLGRGVHPKIVSEQLGHSQIAITLDTYSHVTPTMQREAAQTMDALLAGPA